MMDPAPVKTPSPKSPSSIMQGLDELYDALRGSAYVTSLLDAKKAFQAKNYVEVLRLVRSTGDIHHRTHLSLLQVDPQKLSKSEDSEKILAKQAKLQNLLVRFAEVAAQLEKLARVQPELPQTPPPAKNSTEADYVLTPQISEEFREKFQAAEGDAAQMKCVVEWFHTQAVEAEKHLQLGALYSLCHQGQVHLLRLAKRNAAMATISFESALSRKPLKPIPLETIVGLVEKRALTRLMPKKFPGGNAEPDGDGDFTVSILNKGSFTQLQMAAQATGLLPNADGIGFIRDNEFRLKKYQECFDRIEGLFVHMRTAADQRTQRLRQEEINYKSGVLKMSPKQWLMKQQRDIAQTQGILRALRYFTKVMDALRILQSNPEGQPHGESE